MSNDIRNPLTGLTILVVEDDYYQASDTGEVFERAGATVVGPFSSVAAAIGAIAQMPPDCAVIDVNLGRGPEFDLARELKTRGIPTVFVSGYQAAMIPGDLQPFVHLEKPVERSTLIRVVRETGMPGLRR